MILRLHTPKYPLRAFIKSMIYYEGQSVHTAYNKVLPDGHVQLIVELDGRERVLKNKDGQSDSSYQNAWIASIQTKPVIYQFEKNTTTLSIQFEPEGLFTLLGIPMAELHNAMVDAESVMGHGVTQLRQRLLNCIKTDEIFELTTNFLEKEFLGLTLENQFISFVRNKLNKNMSIANISQEVSYSQKQLIQIFKKHVGISPKKYQRISRFHKSLSMLHLQKQASYSDIVYSCHFYDQAHFINEFRHFTDYTPSQYSRLKRDYSHIIAIDEYR